MELKGIPTIRNYIVKTEASFGIDWETRVEASSREEASYKVAKVLRDSLKTIGINLSYGFIGVHLRATVEEKLNSWDKREVKVIDTSVITPEDLQWFTGFWEGDGTVVGDGDLFEITIGQKEKEPLEAISTILHLETRPTNNSSGWSLHIGGKRQSANLLTEIDKYLVSPQRVEQIAKVTGYILHTNSPTDSWIAGFWDADGHSSLNSMTLFVAFTQKDRDVLDSINNYFGDIGYLYPYRNAFGYYIAGSKGEAACSAILRYSKYPRKKKKLIEELVLLATFNPKVYRKMYDNLLEKGLLECQS